MRGGEFLRGRKHPYFSFAVLIMGKVGSGGLSLLAFMLMAASVSAGDMSAYAVAVAIVSVLSVTSESSEFAYVRTVAEIPRFAQPVALRFMARSKAFTIVLCAVISSVLLLCEWLQILLLPRWLDILPYVCMQAIMTSLLGAYTTWLVGEDRQREFTQVSLLSAVMAVVASFGIWLFDGDIVSYLIIYAGLMAGLCLYLFCNQYSFLIRLWRVANAQFRVGSARSTHVFEKYASVYKAVLGSAFLAVIKSNALVLVLGHQNNESALATFVITKRVFDFLHKGMAGFLEQLYIRISKMADEKGVGIQRGMGVLYILRFFVMILVGVLLVAYFNFTENDSGSFSPLALISVMGSFLVMFFVTIATLVVSKYEPQVLFRNAVFTAIVHAVVPVIFSSVSSSAVTILSHVFSSAISGLPLCFVTFCRHSYSRVMAWYLINLCVVLIGFLWIAYAL